MLYLTKVVVVVVLLLLLLLVVVVVVVVVVEQGSITKVLAMEEGWQLIDFQRISMTRWPCQSYLHGKVGSR